MCIGVNEVVCDTGLSDRIKGRCTKCHMKFKSLTKANHQACVPKEVEPVNIQIVNDVQENVQNTKETEEELEMIKAVDLAKKKTKQLCKNHNKIGCTNWSVNTFCEQCTYYKISAKKRK